MASIGIPDPVGENSDSFPPTLGCQKKSWEQLRQAVRKSRRLACLLLSRVPHSFTFQQIDTISGPRVRAYFLGVPSGSRENTLLYVDIDLDSTTNNLEDLQWKLLLDSFTATPLHGQFSKEEQLLRERKRLGSFGITSYDYNDCGRFILPACGSLFMCTDYVEGHGVSFQVVCFLSSTRSWRHLRCQSVHLSALYFQITETHGGLYICLLGFMKLDPLK